MKRSDELAPLSREHHVALEMALRLRRATRHDAGAVARATLEFWRSEGSAHFRAEEELLLPAFTARSSAEDADCARVLAEHDELRRRFATLEQQAIPPLADLHALGELLSAHVRYEERTLFPRIEEALPPGELVALGAELAAAGARRSPPRA